MSLQSQLSTGVSNTIPVNLKDFFEGKPIVKEFVDEESTPTKLIPREIEIPRIQRSYAQGRVPSANEKRRRFLASIHDYLWARKPMTLDFVYGNIEGNKLVPLEGQQRLTTLFLLHWYASRHAGSEARTHVMFRAEQFNYKTRYSSRDFLSRLICFQPDLSQGHTTISEQITAEQGWFAVEWSKDPTIASMLVMIDAIDDKFSDLAADLWERLDLITFYMLDVTSMRQTDDIYVRMNSRGRELTDFEHFKAELLKCLKSAGIETDVLSRKIDMEWADMLWPYRNEANVVDTAFLRLFRFVCMVISYRLPEETFDRNGDAFSLVKRYFTAEITPEDTPEDVEKKRSRILANLKLLERVFDIWTAQGDLNRFFGEYVADEREGHVEGKILDRGLWLNPVKSWINSQGNALRLFTYLYMFTVVLEKRPELIGTSCFRRRLRLASNLIKNSSDREITDSPNSDAGNRMPAILQQIDKIMLSDGISRSDKPGFQRDAIEEEFAKFAYTEGLTSIEQEQIFRLEDHRMLDGMVEVVDYRVPERFHRFEALFDRGQIPRSLLECGLLASGDYSVGYWSNYRCIGTGASADWAEGVWKDLLRRIAKTEAKNNSPKQIFRDFLDAAEFPSVHYLQQIIDGYLLECESKHEFDWRYYYIKYPEFRRKRYGLITLDYSSPYSSLLVHFTKQQWSNNSQQPFLRAAIGESYSKDYDPERQPYAGQWLKCGNDSWLFYETAESADVIRKISIPQTETGIDKVDRIELFKSSAACV